MPPRRKAAQKPCSDANNKQKLLSNLDLEVNNRASQLQTQAQMLALSLDYSCKAILQRLSPQVKNMTISELYSQYQGNIANIFNDALGDLPLNQLPPIEKSKKKMAVGGPVKKRTRKFNDENPILNEKLPQTPLATRSTTRRITLKNGRDTLTNAGNMSFLTIPTEQGDMVVDLESNLTSEMLKNLDKDAHVQVRQQILKMASKLTGLLAELEIQ